MNRKRTLALAVTATLFAAALAAAPMDRLVFSLGNDWYTLGLGDNLDDRLSYGSHVDASWNGFDLRSSIMGITDKIGNQTRYDLAELYVSHPFRFPAGALEATLVPSAGFLIAGDLHSQSVQNAVHRFLELDQLFLTYDSDSAIWHPTVGLSSSISQRKGTVAAGLDATWRTSFGWETALYGGLFFDWGSVLRFGVGYTLVENAPDAWETHDVMSDSYSGATLSYRFDGGLFQTDWIYHDTGRISYGTFGFNLADFWAPKTYEQTGFTFGSGFLNDPLGHRNRTFSLSYRSFVFVTRHKNGPLANLPDTQETRMNIGSWMAGYEREADTDGFVQPYGRILGGLQRYHLDYQFNQSVIEELRPTIGIEGGVLLIPEGRLVTGDDTYRIRLVLSLQYVFGAGSVRSQEPDFASHAQSWLFMFGTMFEIGHDL